MTTSRTVLTAALGCSLLIPLASSAAAAGPDAPAPGASTSVVVQIAPGAVGQVTAAVRRAGGTVTHDLPIVDGVAATVPAGRLDALRHTPGVRAVVPDTALEPMAYSSSLGYDPVTDTGSLYAIASMTGAHTAYKAGLSGKGVDVALIDTGIAPVPGLTSGNVVNGPDLSFDSQERNLQFNDGFGHGTHMASIIAGRDVAQASPASYVDQTRYNGIAPDARLVNVKVGAADGAVDVSQVLAAFNWIVENRVKDGFNIRVINLSYGTDSTQPYQADLLSYAAEQAWKAGIVVVASGGNDGNNRDYLASPAQNPLIIAVGAQDPMGTLATKDDTVPTWASKGGTSSLSRHVDLVAPGVHVMGLRTPNSSIDYDNPGARTGTRFLRGNGTSQAAAVVSGAAALYLQKYPTATPDQVKKALTYNAVSFTGSPQVYRGSGALNIGYAVGAALPANAVQGGWAPSAGTGTLEATRGSVHVVDDSGDASLSPVVLNGEKDIFGTPFNASTWSSRTASRTTWSDGSWLGQGYTGEGWSGSSWAGRTWSGRTWSGLTWAGRTWSGRTWSGRTWSGDSWDGRTWSGRTWSGRTWSGRTWSGDSWAGVTWQ